MWKKLRTPDKRRRGGPAFQKCFFVKPGVKAGVLLPPGKEKSAGEEGKDLTWQPRERSALEYGL